MKQKCLEYYLDSSVYTAEDVQASIDETKKDFANKDVYTTIYLNKFGVYVITFYFENKNTLWNRIRIFFKKKEKKNLLLEQNNKQQKEKKEKKQKSRLEKYYGNHYGQYKSTGTYRPY